MDRALVEFPGMLGIDFQGPLSDWYNRSQVVVVIVYGLFVLTLAIIGFQLLFRGVTKKSETLAQGTTITLGGNTIGQLNIYVTGATAPGATAPAAPPLPPPPQPPSAEAILENGGFEQGFVGWGIGWFEDHYVKSGRAALTFNGAVARWYIDDRMPHSGKASLRIEHDSTYLPHRFSTFSQRVKVVPGRRYEVRFWTYVEAAEGPGAFSLRVVPSRATWPAEWDQFKVTVDRGQVGRWQERRRAFESGSDWFFDVRFAAEGPLKAWVDDVSLAIIDSAANPVRALPGTGSRP